jgi:hypothetical protein
MVPIATASECFAGVEHSISRTRLSGSELAQSHEKVEVTIELDKVEELLPITVRGGHIDSRTLKMELKEIRYDTVSQIALGGLLNSPAFSERCLALVAAGAEVVWQSAAGVDFVVTVTEESGETLVLKAKIPDIGPVGIEVSDTDVSMTTLRALDPVTLGVNTYRALDLIESQAALPEVAVELPPEPTTTPTDAGAEPDTVDPPLPVAPQELPTNSSAWVECHQACASIGCITGCNDVWFTCSMECSLDNPCSERCAVSRTECSAACDVTASTCHAACDDEHL